MIRACFLFCSTAIKAYDLFSTLLYSIASKEFQDLHRLSPCPSQEVLDCGWILAENLPWEEEGPFRSCRKA